MYSIEQLLEFEVINGTSVIKLPDIKKAFDFFEYGNPFRIYFILMFVAGMRPSEPITDITWANFNNGRLIYKPHKQLKRNVTRYVKLPSKVWSELMHYRDNNFFYKMKLFSWKNNHVVRRRFNGEIRHKLGGDWSEKSIVLRKGRVPQFYKYELRSFRTTMATLVYYYYSLPEVYGPGDLALQMTCNYMAHTSRFMTAQYYIKRKKELEIDNYPKLTLLHLIDHIIYDEIQLRLDRFEKERQSIMIEY